MNIPIRESAVELQHLEQTLLTAGWAMIFRRVEEMRVAAVVRALKAKTWEEFLEERGKVRSLESVLDVPGILKQEIAERLEKEGR